jgi:hypothetical protein
MRGQSLRASSPLSSFEVATIKLSHSGGSTWPGSTEHIAQQFEHANVHRERIQPGVQFRPSLGGPGWIDTNWYVIDGKIPAPSDPERLPPTPTGTP